MPNGEDLKKVLEEYESLWNKALSTHPSLIRRWGKKPWDEKGNFNRGARDDLERRSGRPAPKSAAFAPSVDIPTLDPTAGTPPPTLPGWHRPPATPRLPSRIPGRFQTGAPPPSSFQAMREDAMRGLPTFGGQPIRQFNFQDRTPAPVSIRAEDVPKEPTEWSQYPGRFQSMATNIFVDASPPAVWNMLTQVPVAVREGYRGQDGTKRSLPHGALGGLGKFFEPYLEYLNTQEEFTAPYRGLLAAYGPSEGIRQPEVRDRYDILRKDHPGLLGIPSAAAGAFRQGVAAGEVTPLKRAAFEWATSPEEWALPGGLGFAGLKLAFKTLRRTRRATTGARVTKSTTKAIDDVVESITENVGGSTVKVPKIKDNVRERLNNLSADAAPTTEAYPSRQLILNPKQKTRARDYIKKYTDLDDRGINDVIRGVMEESVGMAPRDAVLRTILSRTPRTIKGRYAGEDVVAGADDILREYPDLAHNEIEKIISRVGETTTIKTPGGKLAAQELVTDHFGKLVAGGLSPAKARHAYSYVAAHTRLNKDEVKNLVDWAQREVKGQAGKKLPDIGTVSTFRRSIRESDGTFKTILEDTAIGETVDRGLVRRFEGSVTAAVDAARKFREEGEDLLLAAGIGKKGFTTRQRIAFSAADMVRLRGLYRALHNPSLVANGTIEIPDGLRAVYNKARELTNLEQTSRVDFNGKQATIEDYFYRGWKPPEDFMRARSRGIELKASFQHTRVDETWDQMIERGFEPLSWNPFEQWQISHMQGARNRLQAALVDDLRKMNPDNAVVIPGSAIPGKEVRFSIGPFDITKGTGYRVPDIGPVFRGSPSRVAGQGRINQIAVTDQMANYLENVFGKTPSIRTPHIRLGPLDVGKVDMYPIIRALTFIPKRFKLFLSIFQQRDFLTRNVTGGFARASHELWGAGLNPLDSAGWARRKAAAAALMKIPKSSLDILHSNVGPGARKQAREWYRSDTPLIEGRPGVNPAALVRAGLSQIDITLLGDLNAVPREVATALGLLGNKKAMRLVGDLEYAMRTGLFEGVYPVAIKTDIENNIAKMVDELYPGLTDGQLNARIAEVANLKYSTLPASQSVTASFRPWVRQFLVHVFFSLGENEGLLRQATQTIGGRNSAYWARQHVGSFLALAFVANAIHFASTGSPLPAGRYIPLKSQDETFLGIRQPLGYNNRLFAPNVPITDRSVRQVTADLVGQLDTAFRILSPMRFLEARTAVGIGATKNLIMGKDYYGREVDPTPGPGTLPLGGVDGIVARTVQLLKDMWLPIGIAEAGFEQAQASIPALGKITTEGEARLGRTAKWWEGLGIDLRSDTVPRLRDVMVEQAIAQDPQGARDRGIERGQGIKDKAGIVREGELYNKLPIEYKNWVDQMPVNNEIIEELKLRGEERVLDEDRQELKDLGDKYYEDLTEQANKAKDVEPEVQGQYYRYLTSGIRDKFNTKRAEIYEKIGPWKQKEYEELQKERDYYGLFYTDDKNIYATFFKGEDYVPVEKETGHFNSYEYERRKEAFDKEYGEGAFSAMKGELRSRKNFGLGDKVPAMELKRMKDMDFLIENYWTIPIKEDVLNRIPKEMREPWKKYVGMSEIERKIVDGEGSLIGKHPYNKYHRIDGKDQTFKQFYDDGPRSFNQKLIRMREPNVQDALRYWGYVEGEPDITLRGLLRQTGN